MGRLAGRLWCVLTASSSVNGTADYLHLLQGLWHPTPHQLHRIYLASLDHLAKLPLSTLARATGASRTFQLPPRPALLQLLPLRRHEPGHRPSRLGQFSLREGRGGELTTCTRTEAEREGCGSWCGSQEAHGRSTVLQDVSRCA